MQVFPGCAECRDPYRHRPGPSRPGTPSQNRTWPNGASLSAVPRPRAVPCQPNPKDCIHQKKEGGRGVERCHVMRCLIMSPPRDDYRRAIKPPEAPAHRPGARRYVRRIRRACCTARKIKTRGKTPQKTKPRHCQVQGRSVPEDVLGQRTQPPPSRAI